MPRLLQNSRPLRAANIVLLLLLAGTGFAVLPGTALALGGPWPITVSAEGEVRRPGAFTLPRDATLSALISAAGGFTDNADPRGATLLRASAREAQEAELRRAADRLASDTSASQSAAEAARPVVALLLGLRPSGRVPVRVTHPRLLKNSPADLPLENGDALRVPAKVGTVTVAGAVRGASRDVPFSPKLPLEVYVRHAGGYAEDAERDHVFLLRADGTTALLTPGFISWNPESSRWEVTSLGAGVPAIGPGDTIVVPRPPGPGLPSKSARRIRETLMRASEIAGAPVILPGPGRPSSPP